MQAPSAVYTITDEDIKYSGAKKISDVFRMVPGLDVVDINSFYSGVQSRGYSFVPKYAREMLVLIDGRTVYTPEINATFWDQIPLFLEDIERIEVIRGPNAALYGANAFNGVINIITKDPEDAQGALVSATIGNQQSQWETARFGGTAGNLCYRVTAGYHETEGFKSVSDHLSKPQVTARADYQLDATQHFSLQGGYTGGERELSRTVQPDITSFFLMTKYEKSFNAHNKLLVQYYHDYRNSEMTFGHADKLWEEDVEIQYNRDGDKYNMVIGAGLRYDFVKHGFLSGQTYKEYALNGPHDLSLKKQSNHILKLFGNYTYRLTEQLHLTGALMAEDNDFVGTMFSPKAVLVYLPTENNSLRFSLSRAYRTPSFIENEADFAVPVAFKPFYLGQEGNRDLKPERMVAYELGYRGRFLNNTLTANIETFYHNINNIILYSLKPNDPGIYRFENRRSNHVRGVEASFAWKLADWWRLTMSYTYQKATDDYLKGLVIENKYSMGNRFMLPMGFAANMQLYYVGRTRYEKEAWIPASTVKDYTRLDVRLSKTFFKEKLEVALIGQNLLDPRHYEYPLTLSAGEAYRAFMLEISYSFGGK
jgi:iron complex outermembrane receptor protein